MREAIYITFKTLVEGHFRGQYEYLRLSVQFMENQLMPQDIHSFADVAKRSGCHQSSTWNAPVVTFTGNLYNILTALSYMVSFF